MQLLPDPPDVPVKHGAIAQLGERLLCKQEVIGSIPIGSTNLQLMLQPAEPRTQFYGLATAPCLLFKNPEEVFVLTLSFQAKKLFCLILLRMSRSQCESAELLFCNP